MSYFGYMYSTCKIICCNTLALCTPVNIVHSILKITIMLRTTGGNNHLARGTGIDCTTSKVGNMIGK